MQWQSFLKNASTSRVLVVCSYDKKKSVSIISSVDTKYTPPCFSGVFFPGECSGSSEIGKLFLLTPYVLVQVPFSLAARVMFFRFLMTPPGYKGSARVSYLRWVSRISLPGCFFFSPSAERLFKWLCDGRRLRSAKLGYRHRRGFKDG